MTKIVYELSNEMEKTFDGGRFHSIKFSGQFVFTELTLEDRKLLNLPTTKTIEKEEVELKGDEIPTEIINHLEHMPPFESEEIIKATAIKRMETRKSQYEDKLVVVPNEKLSVVADKDFKEILKKETEEL